jgi:hypothetical protein
MSKQNVQCILNNFLFSLRDFYLLLFSRGNRGKLTGKIHFSRLRVRSASLADLANFIAIIFAIVHLFRLGSNGF